MNQYIQRISFYKLFHKLDHRIFYLSVFFLPSALPISIFLLLTLIINFIFKDFHKVKGRNINFLYFFIVIGMIISCLISYKNFDAETINSYWSKTITLNTTKSNIFLDLFNWVPLFLLNWTAQNYLKSAEERIKVAKYLLLGTVPVLFSCMLQYWFNIYGPFKFLFGSIVWFQKPLEYGIGVSGLFSNQNYSGSWLATILPFSIFLILNNKDKVLRYFSSLFTIFISYWIVLTNSRNAFFGLVSSYFFIFGLNAVRYFFRVIKIIILICIPLYFLIPNVFNDLTQIIFYNHLFTKLFNFEITNFFNYPRLEILNISLDLISQRPIWGYGAGSFAAMYGLSGGKYDAVHTHSLPLQVAYNYGIPLAIFLCLLIAYIYFRTLNKVFLKEKKAIAIDKCWIISTSIALFYNIADITYYDGKLSILLWILLAGMSSISNRN